MGQSVAPQVYAQDQAIIEEEESTLTWCRVAAHWAVRGVQLPAVGADYLAAEGDTESETPVSQLMAFSSLTEIAGHLLRAFQVFARQTVLGAWCMRCVP